MASIGDLFFSLRAEDKQLQVDVRKAGDSAGTSFGARMSASLKKSWSGQEIGKGLVQGLGLAGGLGAAALFTTAISKIGDVLSDATQAALAEEVSIQKLGTALRSNIPNWNGQTAAIESVLKARMKLGFSDDEQRDSLARIVVATKDVNQALKVQRVAMDLSRLKGISLAEASDALIKVEAGQFRALKALGIQLPKNATATEALAAVEKAAAGQAEDYANTNSGKLLVSQVKVGEAMEKLGAKTMPLFVTATEAAANVVTLLTDGFDALAGKAPDDIETTENALLSLADVLSQFGPGAPLLHDAAERIRKDMAEARTSVTDAASSFESRAADIGRSMDDVGDASGDLARDVKADTKVITKSWEEMRDDVVDAAKDLIDKAMDPVEARDRLIATNAEIAAARRVLASKTATAAEIRDAQVTLHSTVRDTAESVLTLARAGQQGSKAYNTGVANLKAAVKAATGPTKTYLQGVLDKIHQIELDGKVVPINIKVNSKTGNIGISGRAAGGPVQAGVPYLVGERRTEVFVPNVSGHIEPSVSTSPAMRTPVGGTTVVNLTNNGMPLREKTPAELVAQFRRRARMGNVQPPRKTGTWDE